MDAEVLRDRFRGAIVGTAVGDALGAPFEGRRSVGPDQIGQWTRARQPLRWTDDTHMTIGVAQSLVAVGGFDGDDMAERLRANYEAEPWRGYGAGPPMVFAAVRAGADWRRAAGGLFGGAGSFGNGAAMRSAPIGLFAWRDLDRAAGIAMEAAGITHAHELGRQGAAVQACATAWLAGADGGQAPEASGRLLDAVRRVAPEPALRQRLDAVGALAQDAPTRAVVAALGNGIAATESVPTAVHAALRNLGSFADTVRYAIGLGGDTDTIAAMAGALSGAHLGLSAIPTEWVERLEAAGTLVALADDLLRVAPA